jgi:Rps23 Pro-64 3,4-dihydroxylase Tpa1-like proline 4-hydroxylase
MDAYFTLVLERKIVEIVKIKDPMLGIYLYKNMLTKDLNLVERLEKTMSVEDKSMFFKWSEATVGYKERMPEYRDCYDFKVSEQMAENIPETHVEIKNIFFDIKGKLDQCIVNYEQSYNIKMEYMEAINFVKYGVGQHFQVHADHGFSYICTVSSVMYLNDEYKGGELWFPNFDLKIKPDYGDIIIFPSTYIYAHASLPVTEGTKYSAVTMFDYNDKAHGPLMTKSTRTVY